MEVILDSNVLFKTSIFHHSVNGGGRDPPLMDMLNIDCAQEPSV